MQTKPNWVLFGIIGVLVIIVVGLSVSLKNSQTVIDTGGNSPQTSVSDTPTTPTYKPTSTAKPTSVPKPTTSVPTGSLGQNPLIYKNSAFGFQISYPSNLPVVGEQNGFTIAYPIDQIKTTIDFATIAERVYNGPCSDIKSPSDVDKSTVYINGVAFVYGGSFDSNSTRNSVASYYRAERGGKCFNLTLSVTYFPPMYSPTDHHALTADEKSQFNLQTEAAVDNYVKLFNTIARTFVFTR